MIEIYRYGLAFGELYFKKNNQLEIVFHNLQFIPEFNSCVRSVILVGLWKRMVDILSLLWKFKIMDKNKVLIIILVLVSVLTGFCFGVIAVSEMIYKQNLEGYHAVATYSTNSLGEVSITKIEWKK